MINSVLHINNKPIKREFIKNDFVLCGGSKIKSNFYLETLPNGKTYLAPYAERNRDKILIILDGYDEIAHSMTKELEQLLMAVLSSPRYYIILTSRPITISLNRRTVAFDRELENVGFTKENIKNYVRKFYPEIQNQLLQFIASNIQLANIAHIPLNLELMCSVWNPNKVKQHAYTVGQLYQDIAESLFGSMIEKGILLQGLLKPELEARQSILMELLGEIAFTGMNNKRSIIFLHQVKAIVEKKEKELGVYTLFEELLGMGIIKALSVNKDQRKNDVYFIHHTFQEYFAAFKMAKSFECLKDDEEYAVTINKLRRHKYTPYYEMMWISIVGILYTRCNQSEDYLPLLQFWDEFESHSRELLGIKHDTLRLKLLEECPPLENHPATLKNLKATLTDANHVLSELFKVIESKDKPAKRLDAISAIIGLGMKNAEIESKLTRIVVSESDSPGVKFYAAEALLTLGYNSNAALYELLYGKFKSSIQTNAIIRVYKAPKVDPNIKSQLQEKCRNILAEKDLKIIPVNLRDPELLRVIERDAKELFYSNGGYICRGSVLLSYTAFIPLGVFFAHVFAQSPHTKAEIPAMAATVIAGISASGIALGTVTGSAAAASAIVKRKTPKFFSSLIKELDVIALSNDKDENILKAICSKSQNNIMKITAWSSEGVLNLALAIHLYSFSSRKAWLAPLESITFIYKDPTMLLAVSNNLIMHRDKQLTKNIDETKTVLQVMIKTYERSKISTNVLKHYLSDTRLGIISQQERDALERRIRSNRPMGLTPLHKAARDGNLEMVIELLGQKNTDVNHFDNQDADTPLVLAIKNAITDRHWQVLEHLVENGADVNISGAIFKVMELIRANHLNEEFLSKVSPLILRMIRKSCFTDEGLIEKILRFAIDDYRLQKSVIGKDHVFNRLSTLITGENRDWMKNAERCDYYLMYLSNAKSITRDGVEIPKPEGGDAYEILLMRLHTYLVLYVKLCAGEMLSLPELSGKFLSFKETKKMLLAELKTLIQTWIFCKTIYFLEKFNNHQNLIDLENEIELIYSAAIKENLINLEKGREFIVLVSKFGAGHCIYAALHKLQDDAILVRIDNRYLFFNDSLRHTCAPYVLTQTIEGQFNIILELDEKEELKEIKEPKRMLKIKPFCSNILKLKDNNKFLVPYIRGLFCLNVTDTERENHIYGNSIAPEKLSAEALVQINTWPYHLMQEQGTNNCTLSSYNLGISARHGMEFFEWLIEKEQQLAPPFSSVNRSKEVNKNDRWA